MSFYNPCGLVCPFPVPRPLLPGPGNCKPFAQMQSTSTASVLYNASFTFSNLFSSSPTITLSSTAATFLVGGTYLFSADVYDAVQSVGTFAQSIIGFSINGAAPSISFTPGINIKNISAQQILNLPPNATVSLVNVSTLSATIIPNGTVAGETTAQMTIQQL